MACKPHCMCKCDTPGCECWDGIAFTKQDEKLLSSKPEET